MERRYAGFMFDKILVGVDFSDSSARALDVARSHFPNAALLLLHVVDARAMSIPDLSSGSLNPVAPSAQLVETMERADTTALDNVARAGEEREMIVGDPALGIIDTAARWGADLIVVGTHRQGGLEHFLVGSVAEQVVRRSAVPVLTVRLEQR